MIGTAFKYQIEKRLLTCHVMLCGSWVRRIWHGMVWYGSTRHVQSAAGWLAGRSVYRLAVEREAMQWNGRSIAADFDNSVVVDQAGDMNWRLLWCFYFSFLEMRRY